MNQKIDEEITLAKAMETVGIDASNARERAAEVRRNAKQWLDRVPAPAKLKNFVLHFVNATTDLDIPVMDLAILVGAVAYVVLPFDLIPDLIPLLGWGDDATVVALALKTLRKQWKRASGKGEGVVIDPASGTPPHSSSP